MVEEMENRTSRTEDTVKEIYTLIKENVKY